MQCPQCQHGNREGAKFCNECATPLSLRCPSCETLNPPGVKFCDECATPLTTSMLAPTPTGSELYPAEPQRDPVSYTPHYLAEKILTTRSALEGERKQVTVMFCDIKDSTELIRDLDPEAAQQLLDPAIHIMMDAVHRFEGTVNQVLGDGIMAIFGAPIAHEDHAARACYAALAMQTAMKPYADEMFRSHGVTMRIRVGLNSGEVVVRTIGNDLHMDYSAVGQTTNLASRMEQLAAPGSAVLTAAALRLVEGLVRVNDLGSVPVKGISEPVEVYELTGASAIKRRLQAAVARGLTKFVGRDTEIGALNQARERAEKGHGQIVAALGEAGVGKSRLVYEFIHSHHTQGWLVLESASVSYGKATPYFPVIDLLKRYVHVGDGDDSRTIRAKVTGQILTLDESLQETIPALLSLLDVLTDDSPFLQLDSPQRRQHTLDGLRRILLRESQVQPLLLVFEDLHWIDSETQSLLDSLVESLPAARLLLLVNYRPEYRHTWGSKTYYTQLRLDSLAPASAGAFLTDLLGDDASLVPLKQLLIARVAGNPFFLEESVRTLVEIGMLAGERSAYRLDRPLADLQVPATVHAVLAARIDRLPPEEKRLLHTAAVIGTVIPLPLLQAVVELSEAALHGGLAHLQAMEFLYETRLFPELEYSFKHALTHEVAYGSLLHERRRVLHARIVEALEGLARDRPSEQVEWLAHHALRGEVWDKAVTYSWQAGEKAMARSAYHEAVGSFEQALSILPRLPETRNTQEQAIDLRLALRTALHVSGDLKRLPAVLQEAEALAVALGDPRRQGQIAASLTVCLRQTGAYDQAIAAAQRALALATTSGNDSLHTLATLYLGRVYHVRGDYRRAIDYFRQTVASLDGTQRHNRFGQAVLPAVHAYAQLSMCHAELGTFAAGLTHGDEGLKIAKQVAHPGSVLWACYGSGLLSLRQGDLRRALPLLEQAIGICHEAALSVAFPGAAAALGTSYTLAGRIADAVPLLMQATEQVRAMGMVDFQVRCSLALSEAQLLAGLLEASYALAESALVVAREHQERGNQAYALRLLGDIAARRKPSDVVQANAHYQQALALANELGMCPLQAHCHRGLSTLYRQTGQAEQARVELSTAIGMYRDMEMTFWLPETEAALAEVEGKA